MNVAPELSPGPVNVVSLDDGMVVRLEGYLDESCLPALRDVLLRPRPAHRRDVMVDAGHVASLSDEVLAVLVAAAWWAMMTGGRFRLSAASPPLRELIETLDLVDALPMDSLAIG